MKICNYCGKEIKETKEKYQSYKGVNVEVGLWQDMTDGNCIKSDFIIKEVHKECGQEIIKLLKNKVKEITKLKK